MGKHLRLQRAHRTTERPGQRPVARIPPTDIMQSEPERSTPMRFIRELRFIAHLRARRFAGAALACLVAGGIAWSQAPSRGAKNRPARAAASPGANLKPKAVFKGFPDWVACVAFSPDGKTLAAGSYGVAKLFDVAEERERAVLSEPKGMVKALSFSVDGRILASGSYQLPFTPMRELSSRPATTRRCGFGTLTPGNRG